MNILLTHLHLDHIQGLVFFAPAFRPSTELAIWGPKAADASLQERIGRYISAPLSPVEVRELPSHVAFREAPTTEWQIGPATLRAASVTHRGPTLGYRITEGDTSVCYIPDHEPALGARLETRRAGVDLGLRPGPAAPRCWCTTASTRTTSTPTTSGGATPASPTPSPSAAGWSPAD